MITDEANFGKPISDKLSAYLIDWTTEEDVKEAARLTGVSFSTVAGVKRGKNSLTETNSGAIVALMRLAVRNCTHKIEYAKKVQKDISPLIP